MARMKRFLTYFLCLIGFMILSYILEDALLSNMYVKMVGNANSSYDGVTIEDVEASASNVTGTMSFKITDDSNDGKEKYVKVDLYNKRGNLVATKYIPLNNLDENNQKEIMVKLKGKEIRNYNLSVVSELPDKSNIMNVFGWEFDTSDVFGMDLSNVTIFGKKLSDLFTANDVFNPDRIRNGLGGVWNWIISLTSSVPWWGYAIASGIVLWYLPSRFLFGIFP